jgi:DNA polymerase-1
MDFHYISSITDFGEFVKSLQDSNTVGLDVETDKLDPFTHTWLLLQLALNDNNIFVFDVRKLGIPNITYIIQLLKDTNKLIIGHNLKFDFKIIYHNTKEILTNCFDTMLAETMIYNGLNKNYYCSLETLVKNYFDIDLDKEIRKTFFNFTGELTNQQLYYAAEDVQYLSRIRDIQLKKLIEQKQEKVVDLEMSLVPVFMHIEYTGIYLNKEDWLKNKDYAEKQIVITKSKLLEYILNNIKFDQYKNALEVVEKFKVLQKNKLTKTLKITLETLRGEFIKNYFKEQFNLDSPLQLKIILNSLGIPVENTNEKTLLKYQKHEIIKDILEYRGYTKQVSTYGVEFLNHINSVTDMIHTQYNQLGAVTGRLSSENPNLQNQPRLQSFRKCYQARPGYVIGTFDYSQAELRYLGEFTKEWELINTFIQGKDPHAKTATFLYEKPIDEINKDERHDGKTLNFATVYGTSAWGLHYNFGIDLEIAEDWLDRYYKGYKTLKAVQDAVGDAVWENKYSSTLMGRKRYFEDKRVFSDYKERDKYIAKTKREGFNFIIQGGIADIIKIAMRDIFYENPFGHDKLRVLLQTHDELCVEIAEDIVEEGVKFIEDKMLKAEGIFLKLTPCKLDYFVGKSWTKE